MQRKHALLPLQQVACQQSPWLTDLRHLPRGFDWGNHFNEYAGFECDYTR
jgi:hypothetical protein